MMNWMTLIPSGMTMASPFDGLPVATADDQCAYCAAFPKNAQCVVTFRCVRCAEDKPECNATGSNTAVPCTECYAIEQGFLGEA
jgi:hypothetical protein